MSGKRNAALQVKIPLVVKDGYHVNSNQPSEEYLIPLKLTWTEMGALEGGTVTYPKPALEKYEFSEQRQCPKIHQFQYGIPGPP